MHDFSIAASDSAGGAGSGAGAQSQLNMTAEAGTKDSGEDGGCKLISQKSESE